MKRFFKILIFGLFLFVIFYNSQTILISAENLIKQFTPKQTTEAPLTKTDTSATSIPAPTPKPTPTPTPTPAPSSELTFSCPSIMKNYIGNLITNDEIKIEVNFYLAQTDCSIEGFVESSSSSDLPINETKISGSLDDRNNIEFVLENDDLKINFEGKHYEGSIVDGFQNIFSGNYEVIQNSDLSFKLTSGIWQLESLESKEQNKIKILAYQEQKIEEEKNRKIIDQQNKLYEEGKRPPVFSSSTPITKRNVDPVDSRLVNNLGGIFHGLEYEEAQVTRVWDGDTIDVFDLNEKKTKRIRFLGADTPEMNKNECFSSKAFIWNRSILITDMANYIGRKVRLYKGKSGYDKDKFGRYLRYLTYISVNPYNMQATEVFHNNDLIRYGFADLLETYEYQQLPHIYQIFVNSEREANVNRLGLWGACR